MSGLKIPDRAKQYWFRCGCSERDHVDILHLCERDGYTDEGVRMILAAELRRQADDLHELRRTIRDEDGRGIRSSAMAEGISRLRKRADDLDPDGTAW